MMSFSITVWKHVLLCFSTSLICHLPTHHSYSSYGELGLVLFSPAGSWCHNRFMIEKTKRNKFKKGSVFFFVCFSVTPELFCDLSKPFPWQTLCLSQMFLFITKNKIMQTQLFQVLNGCKRRPNDIRHIQLVLRRYYDESRKIMRWTINRFICQRHLRHAGEGNGAARSSVTTEECDMMCVRVSVASRDPGDRWA